MCGSTSAPSARGSWTTSCGELRVSTTRAPSPAARPSARNWLASRCFSGPCGPWMTTAAVGGSPCGSSPSNPLVPRATIFPLQEPDVPGHLQPLRRDQERVERDVVVGEAHLAHDHGADHLALPPLELEDDEGVGDVLLDAEARELPALRLLRHQERGHTGLVQVAPELEELAAELPRAAVVEADDGEGVDDEPRVLPGPDHPLQQALQARERDELVPLGALAHLPAVEERQQALLLQGLRGQPPPRHGGEQARARLLQRDVDRRGPPP